MEASLHSAVYRPRVGETVAVASLAVAVVAAGALKAVAAGAVATWGAGWPSSSCCSTTTGSDSGRPSNY